MAYATKTSKPHPSPTTRENKPHFIVVKNEKILKIMQKINNIEQEDELDNTNKENIKKTQEKHI